MGFFRRVTQAVQSVAAPVTNVVSKVTAPVTDTVKTAFQPVTQQVTKVTAPLTNQLQKGVDGLNGQLGTGMSLISDRVDKVTGVSISVPGAFSQGAGASDPVIAPPPADTSYKSPPLIGGGGVPKPPETVTDPIDRGGTVSGNGAGTFVNFLSEYGAPKKENSPAFYAPLPVAETPATPQEARGVSASSPVVMALIGAGVLVGAFFIIKKV